MSAFTTPVDNLLWNVRQRTFPGKVVRKRASAVPSGDGYTLQGNIELPSVRRDELQLI